MMRLILCPTGSRPDGERGRGGRIGLHVDFVRGITI